LLFILSSDAITITTYNVIRVCTGGLFGIDFKDSPTDDHQIPVEVPSLVFGEDLLYLLQGSSGSFKVWLATS